MTNTAALLATLDQSDLAYLLAQQPSQEGKEALKAKLARQVLISLIRQELEA